MNGAVSVSAATLAQAIRSKEISAVEVVDAHLARIEEVNPKLNAVVQLAADRSRAEAREADKTLSKGNPVGALHGVPFTVKDSIETAGIITTSGNVGRVSFMPERDATVVARMRSAGAILFGKTNVPDLTFSYETDNLVYGRTNNPHDLDRSPGGSCGGEAAIIAAGGSPIGVGSDLGGSLRFPAHFCGICSLKPTSGRVPRTGHFPPAGGVLDFLWHIGPLSRFVEDLELVLPVISGIDMQDPSVVPASIPNPRTIDLRQLRVAFYTDNGLYPPTANTAATVERVARLLSRECAVVQQDRPPELEASYEIPWKLFGADEGAGMRALLQLLGAERVHPYTRIMLERLRGGRLTIEEFNTAAMRLDTVRAAMLAFLREYDVIICPVCAFPALPHGASVEDNRMLGFSYTVPYNVTGWPVVTVRAGTSSEALPIGVQVVSHPWREDVALAAAGLIEKELGEWKAPAF